ncbi:MAG TPA: Tex family protein [Bacillota bacterium]|nr:Tex family protein [Bacillota bacterium]HPF42869.1 Tex family protein [Bacillota bacterium]HPJ86097.1 Tex family protein [Bacillota bacterium]HPQ61494.1 Tex family protein [Bacillota bacterium]HRX92067.1 Tex family protein [Candidatus Izemoplasmatales bacterium]
MEILSEELIAEVAANQNIKVTQVKAVLDLLGEGQTVPFIARYRKEMTGSLDEECIRAIEKEYEYKVNFLKRKDDITRLIDEKGMLTEEVREAIKKAEKLVDLEDIYRPYKEKKKTKATEAIKKGLEPLAVIILTYPSGKTLAELAAPFINETVPTAEEALEGAMYIIAENISDNAIYRKWIREYTFNNGTLVSTKKKDADDPYQTYKNYYEYEEPLKSIKLYRILALNRAEKEKVVNVKITVETQAVLNYLERNFIGKKESECVELVKKAIDDAYKRLIAPSIEREIRSDLSEKAEDQAIHIFSENLRSLLMQPPLKGKNVLGVDPAFRTGCKLAVVDKFGKFLDKGVIYPHESKLGEKIDPVKVEASVKKVKSYLEKYDIDIIAIGNGTASRETEAFIAGVIKSAIRPVKYVIVSEAGASVYSASDLARQEFPDFQVEERSAVSIARRMQDPLSELVKIDPKSIGVGQYQHDVSQNKLTDSLDFVVSTAVNQVGVDVNTASVSLLKFISGLSANVASNIVTYREKHGPFANREKIKDVPQMGPKTFEQAVGFLRILESDNPLDKTPIHPESYETAKTILKTLSIKPEDIGSLGCQLKISGTNRDKLAASLGMNSITINDLLDAFAQPTRDLRDQYPQPLLKSELLKLEDLRPGMELQGTVRNVVDFGAFVDCGIKEAGLVHISKMSKKYVKHPLEVVSVGDIVKVWVLSVDLERKRLQLSMLDPFESNTYVN